MLSKNILDEALAINIFNYKKCIHSTNCVLRWKMHYLMLLVIQLSVFLIYALKINNRWNKHYVHRSRMELYYDWFCMKGPNFINNFFLLGNDVMKHCQNKKGNRCKVYILWNISDIMKIFLTLRKFILCFTPYARFRKMWILLKSCIKL